MFKICIVIAQKHMINDNEIHLCHERCILLIYSMLRIYISGIVVTGEL